MRNFYLEDSVLPNILKNKLSPSFYEWADKQLTGFGELAANEIDERAVHTDREGQPRLIKYDKMGNDVSRIWLNEGYKKTIEQAYGTGIVGYLHKPVPELGHKGNYLYSFAQGYLLSQAEPGFYCPVTLTMATAYLIDHYADEQLKSMYLPHVLSTGETELYEGATFLTERQGGSDVGANEVRAVKEAGHYRLFGEKYFASNAGACGVAMVLARLEDAPEGTKGLSLFLMPWEENRQNSKLKIRRLKDKLGVRAVPSAEVELEGAAAYLVGDPAKGIYYMMEALNLSRMCNAVASIGIMRRAYSEAKQYADQRTAFGNPLSNYPMVRETLVKLAVKQEAETRAVFDLIGKYDELTEAGPEAEKEETAFVRLLIAIMKKETAEQAIHFSHEAIEMHGGNGYIEDFVTPRLLRDAQVLTVWEGTANILGLEVIRLIRKFHADKLFIKGMHDRLSRLSSKGTKLAAPVLEAITGLEKETEEIIRQPEGIQTFYSKKIAEKMSAIYEAVVILEAVKEEDERSEAVARVYLHLAFMEEKVEENPLVLQYYDRIVEEKYRSPQEDLSVN